MTSAFGTVATSALTFRGVEGGRQGLHQQRADQGSGQVEASAGQRRAADHGGDDRVQFEIKAGMVGVRAPDVAAATSPASPAQSPEKT